MALAQNYMSTSLSLGNKSAEYLSHGETYMGRNKQDPTTLRVAPVVREFFQIAHDKGQDYTVIAEKAGVSKETITRWQKSASPNLNTFTACLNAMGYDLFIGNR
tara:strand:- start:773 stop:1084 length:312 start_codon:yes stop_codon:yes gene_type:complete